MALRVKGLGVFLEVGCIPAVKLLLEFGQLCFEGQDFQLLLQQHGLLGCFKGDQVIGFADGSNMLAGADKFLAPIGGIDWIRPEGGLYVWVRLPDEVDTGISGTLFDLAAEEGVLYVPGSFCYPREGRSVQSSRIRLSFGVPSCREIDQGMETLARAIRQVIG